MTALHSAAVQCGTNFPLLGNYVVTDRSINHSNLTNLRDKTRRKMTLNNMKLKILIIVTDTQGFV